MQPTTNRRQFLTRLALPAAAGFALTGITPSLFAQTQATPPPLPAQLVKDFVIAGHGKLDVVKAMLAEHPTLLNACWDWKNGDFETALEGAGHIGYKEGARWLIEQGARANIFVLAMLGHLDVVKGLLTLYPALKNSRGPHGLTLVHHAKKGGDEAAPVLAYLNSIGLTE
jgi:hypothetical protein